MISNKLFLIFLYTMVVILLLYFLSKTSFLQIISRYLRSFESNFHVYQFYKIPQFNEHFQENQLYRQVSAYLGSLPAMEDSDFTNLVSGPKFNDITLRLDANRPIEDHFLSARVWWSNEKSEKTLVLKLRRKDKKRILRPYLQHILSIVDEIEQRKKEIKLYMNLDQENGRWRCVPFTHPATMDTVVMNLEMKNKVKADLETFLKSKQYYHKLGRVWKRSYLLYGESGTGKSSFIAAMAKFLNFDVYYIDYSKVSDDSDLSSLLLQTTSRSMIVIEDLDRLLTDKSKSKSISLSGVLNFMDGIVSCSGEERVMVFTMNSKDQIVDQAVMRPGRIDVHIHFPLCDFAAFKNLASSYLGVKEHKLFPQVEEIFQSGGPSLSPAEIGEIMSSNRTSPTRALKSVISAMQNNNNSANTQRLSQSRSVRTGNHQESVDEAAEGGVFCRESVHTVKEFGKLYGLLRMGSRRKEEILDLGSVDKEKKESSKHGT
ncbi:AAA-ATPase At2g46620-like [Mercurialis annua]|uniref:AAA-ATPase At2g46620-like n=1 Tax=Mercurialis annua TaxID=3986 RepID=UPI00215F86AC|nr:AAA-ATPase At2g46620-like [Mercurialis annua]